MLPATLTNNTPGERATLSMRVGKINDHLDCLCGGRRLCIIKVEVRVRGQKCKNKSFALVWSGKGCQHRGAVTTEMLS